MLDDLLPIEARLLVGCGLSLAVGTFAHESGHLFAAWAVGERPRLASIGAGPIVARLRLPGAWLVVRAFPVGGYVHTLLEPDATRTQRLVTIACGPSANLLLLVGLLLAWPIARPQAEVEDVLAAGVIGQLMLLAGTLIPYRRKVKDYVSVSDGLRLYLICMTRPSESFRTLHAQLLRRHLPQGAPPPDPSPHFPEIVFQRVRRDRKHDAWAQEDVHASLCRVLAQPDLPDAERSLAAELLASNQLYREIRGLKAELAALKTGPRAR